MGCLDDGSLRAFHCAGRIPGGPARLSTPIPRPHSYGIVSRHRPLKSSASGNNVPDGQGSDRGVKSAIALPRILQSAVLGAKNRRVTRSGFRLKILESVCPQGEVQNDHSQNSDKCDAQGGLGGQYRSERCILSRSDSRPVQTSTSVRHSNERRAPSFPIQGPTVRPNVCPTDVYQGNSSAGTPCAPACGLPSSVSRRLATEKSKQVVVGSANKLVAGDHSSSGICAKRAQITTCAHSAFDTYRGGISFGLRSDVPSDDQSSKVRRQDIDTPVGVSHDSLFLAVPPRTAELSNICNSTRQIASQTSATVFACSLGAGLEISQGSCPSEARPVGSSPPLVVGQDVYQSRNVAGHSRSSGASFHRRVPVGLGSTFGHGSGAWELVYEGGHSAHQSSGNVGGVVCPTGISSTAHGPHCSADVRQRLCCGVHSETGGNGVCASVPSYTGGTDPGAGRTDHPSCQAHSRGEECISRPPLQDGQDSAHRVDPPSLGVRGTMHGMGQAQPGSVCQTLEQQTSRVCVPHGRPTSLGCRCHVNVMEGNVCLCIPPICDAGARTRVSTEGSPMRNDPGRPEMAQSVLVRQTIGTSSRLAFGPATEGRSAVPTPQPPEASVTPSSVSTRLEAVKRSLKERGFSQAAADQIARGRRQSSRAVVRAVYDSKWKIFSGWCAGQSVDPFRVTVPQLADFFVFLFQVKRLNPRTIKGYRSAISSTISACGSRTEFSDSQELSSLIRSFQLERPPQRKVAPQWN